MNLLPHVARPVQALALTGLIPVLAGAQGSIVSWGSDLDGQVSGTPAGTAFTAVAAGENHSLALRSDGSVVSWGSDLWSQVSDTPVGTGFTQIASGGYHSLALRSDGSIAAWGRDQVGQVANTPAGTGFIQVAGGRLNSLALHPDGSIAVWGSDSDGQISNAPLGAGYIRITAAEETCMALHSDGSLTSWGNNGVDQVVNTPGGTWYTAIAAGEEHFIALRTDGSVTIWGSNVELQVTDAPPIWITGFTQVASGPTNCKALRSDGTIASWGQDYSGQVSGTPFGTGFTQVAVGSRHSLALRGFSTGTSFCSGDGGNQTGCTNCPCTNNAPVGTVGGCLNSSADSASLALAGSTSVSLPVGWATDLRFSLSGAPSLSFCILNSGDGVAPGNMANPCFGMNSGAQAAAFDGLRCAIMNTRRHGGRSADGNGDVGITNNPWGGESGPLVGIAVAGGGFVAGQTRYFQVINRDDPLLGCMRGLNTSQAVEVTFTP